MSTRKHVTPTPWSYFFVRLLFKFVLKVFYGTICIENAHLIPENGQACIVCANHSNSLTDALLLVTSVPSKKRNFLRLTAKATQFGKRTFTSWLIESAGTVPIHRRKDSTIGEVDNAQTMSSLMKVLQDGDAVCLFPEGMSRYHPRMSPLKTGVARLISDVLSEKRDDPNFSISLLTCSITYMHRQHFRSDVLITFHPPMIFSPQHNPELLDIADFSQIRALTARIQSQISLGTLDSPSWDIIRSAKLAAKIYAPLGTSMSLGEYVRVCRAFVEVFKWAEDSANDNISINVSGSEEENEGERKKKVEWINGLTRDLKSYQNELVRLGVKDDRIRSPLHRIEILRRLFVRALWALMLSVMCLPGGVLWSPVLITVQYAVRNFKKTGPIWDTYDEIAQYKLVYGLISGTCVWLCSMLLTLPVVFITAFCVPAIMWMTLRWSEDAIASSRAFLALAQLLRIGKAPLQKIRKQREDLHARIMTLAVSHLHLPADPHTYFVESGGKEKGRVRNQWESRTKYFSLRRRRKRDWNETLRLYDKVDYEEDAQL